MFLRNSTIAPFFQYIMYFLLLSIAGLCVYYIINIGNKGLPENKRIKFNKNKMLKFLIAIILGVIVITLYRKYSILGSATFSLFVSVLVAFLLNPIVNFFESKGIKRSTGIILTYILLLFILVILFINIIPDLIGQISLFLTNLPSSINYTYDSLQELLIKWNIDVRILDNFMVQLNDYLTGLSTNIPEWTTTFINAIHGSISTFVTLVLIPLITYHILMSKEKIIYGIYNMLPSHIKHDTLYLYKSINFAMNEFVKSRMLMAVFIGFSTGIMLQIFGIPFALVIGFLTMILDIVPYIGPVLATAPALIFAFIKSPMTFVWVVILLWFLQWIEQNIIGAKLFSVSSGIHELVTLLSIIIGGGIFGVWGMILAVPFVIIMKIIYEYILIKLHGETPEFTKDIEKALIQDIKKKQKEEKNRRRKRNNIK